MEVEIYRKQQHKSIMVNADWQVYQSGSRLCKNNTIVRSFNKRVVVYTHILRQDMMGKNNNNPQVQSNFFEQEKDLTS